jgi:hypothetical protein
MAKEGDVKARQRAEREERDAEEQLDKEAGDKVRDLLEKAEPLMELVDNKYRMYQVGQDRLPPAEKRRLLDSMMFQLQQLPKPTLSLKFKVDQLRTRYVTMKDRWDRLIKDIESGKIRRPHTR